MRGRTASLNACTVRNSPTDGRLQSLTYPSGRVLQLAYDNAGRVSSLAFTPYQIASKLAYHPFGDIKAITLLNGIVHRRGQDTNGWPQGYTLGEQPLGFGYDLAGRITGLDQNGSAYDQSFGYDAANRLTSYTGYPALRAYTYDANANRTSETLGAMITSITHVAGSNRIHKVGTQAMAFDAAGNLSSYANKTLTHGADGRLRSTTNSAGTVTYHYDGLGRRVSKSGPATLVPGGFVRYAYDAAHHLIGEYKANGTPIKEYVWLGDLPVAVVHTNPDNTTTAYAIETDHLGTPRLLTDATRAPRWRWTSPPFGEVLPVDDPSGLGAVTFNLRFPGQYYDKETGLHYNWNRYYDPERGRYDQSDPIGLNGGWNTYGYVGGNPLSYADPTGLIKWNGKVFGGALTPFSMPLKLGKWGFAAGFFRYRYELHSDCVRGQRWKVIVLADGKLAGWGIPGTLVGSSASFDDGENGYIDPYVFNGVYQSLSGGISLGAGPSYAGTAMGRAYSKAGIALEAGIDEGFGAFVGNSKVVSATPEPCACKE